MSTYGCGAATAGLNVREITGLAYCYARIGICGRFIVQPMIQCSEIYARRKRRSKRLQWAAYCLGACAFGAGDVARAQLFNPTVLAPPAKPPEPREVTSTGVAAGALGLQEPVGADRKIVTVRAVTLDGAFSELAEQNAAFVQRLQGRRLSLKEIYAAAAELQAQYLAAFPLALLSAPRPNFEDGVIRLVVTDGVIDELKVSGVQESAEKLVRDRLAPLIGRRHLPADEYQRRTQLIGTIAGVAGRTGTAAKPGGRFTLIAALIDNRISGATVVTNRLPKEFGTWEFSQSLALNNALGFGEQIAGAVSSTPDFDRYFDGTAKSQAYSIDTVTPIGNDGLSFGAGYLMAHSRATPLFSLLPQEFLTAGERQTVRFDRVYARLSYPLFLRSDLLVRLQATAEHINNRYRFEPLPLGFAIPEAALFPINDFSRDRYTVSRFSVDGRYQLPWLENATFTGILLYSRGLGGREGSLDYIFGPPLTRLKASPEFSRLNVKARLDLGLPEGFMFSAIGRVQTSFGQPLMVTESFLLDGPEAISGYAAGTLIADRGVTARGEITRPFNVEFLGSNHLLAPYIFGAWGSGVRENLNPGQFRNLVASTIGGGLRTDTNFTGTPFGESLALEFGRDRSNIPSRETGYRTNVTWIMRFAGDPFTPETPNSIPGVLKKGPPEPPPPPILWQGFYAGLNAGYTWDPHPEIATVGTVVGSGVDELFLPIGEISPLLVPFPLWSVLSAFGVTERSIASGGGSISGIQAGYNYQLARFVLGLEADVQGANTRTRRGQNTAYNNEILSTIEPLTFDHDRVFSVTRHSKNVDWLSTVRGRAGYLVTPSFLVYGTGGVAWGGVSANSFVLQNWGGDGPLGPLLQSSGSAGSYAATRFGWTAGLGVEWMFAPNASLKVEYLHYNLGGAHYALSPLVTNLRSTSVIFANSVIPTAQTQFRGDVARVGLNYHFGNGPLDSSPLIQPAAFTSGFYAGLNGAYSWDNSPSVRMAAAPIQAGLDQDFPGLDVLQAATAASANSAKARANGVIGGGQAGYNLIYDRFLAGVEFDLQGATGAASKAVSASAPFNLITLPFGNTNTTALFTKTLDWFGTVRGRAGYALTPSIVAYATGGLAYGGMTLQNEVSHITAADFPFQSTGTVNHISTAKLGWTAGGGVEWSFSPGFSLKAEYLYYDLGTVAAGPGAITDSWANREPVLPPPPHVPPPVYSVNALAVSTSTRFNGQLARLGLNYHFDPAAAFKLVSP